MCYDKHNQVMTNQLVNDFYKRFLFKIYTLSQEVGLLLDIASEFFNNLIPDVREFLVSEEVEVHQILTTQTNHQGSLGLLLVRNASFEA